MKTVMSVSDRIKAVSGRVEALSNEKQLVGGLCA